MSSAKIRYVLCDLRSSECKPGIADSGTHLNRLHKSSSYSIMQSRLEHYDNNVSEEKWLKNTMVRDTGMMRGGLNNCRLVCGRLVLLISRLWFVARFCPGRDVMDLKWTCWSAEWWKLLQQLTNAIQTKIGDWAANDNFLNFVTSSKNESRQAKKEGMMS